jgi:hypothetical protein
MNDQTSTPVNGADPDALAEAAKLGASYRGKPINLDEGVPFDIYSLFARVTYRDYNHRSPDDELSILSYARAFEEAAGVWK